MPAPSCRSLARPAGAINFFQLSRFCVFVEKNEKSVHRSNLAFRLSLHEAADLAFLYLLGPKVFSTKSLTSAIQKVLSLLGPAGPIAEV